MATLLLVGCGKMGAALLSRWVSFPTADVNHVAVVDPVATRTSSGDLRFFATLDAIPNAFRPDIIVFAIKPQQMDAILPSYHGRFGAAPLYLSIAAGKTLAFLASHLGNNSAVIRAMPNTPALIGEGITALVANENVSAAQKETATALMRAVGETLWMEESEMNAVTAISGSGPAYVFCFMEALTAAGQACGLDEKTSSLLVRQTLRGSAMLAETGDIAALRAQVTSPGGTTEAALNALEKGGFETLVKNAVMAAHLRAENL